MPIETCVVLQTRKPVTANFWTNVNDTLLSDVDLLASHCSRYRFDQPVYGVHFQQSLPPLQPFPGVFTADTTAYYPEDREIRKSIDFGRKLARQAMEVERCLTSLET